MVAAKDESNRSEQTARRRIRVLIRVVNYVRDMELDADRVATSESRVHPPIPGIRVFCHLRVYFWPKYVF